MYKYQLLERVLVQIGSNKYSHVVVEQCSFERHGQIVVGYYAIVVPSFGSQREPVCRATYESEIWCSRGVLSIEEGLTHPYSRIRSVAKGLSNALQV